MSHTWEHGETVFTGNSDLSGPIRIRNSLDQVIHVPGRDLIDFVTAHIIRERVSQMEQMGPEEVLGITLPESTPLTEWDRD